MQKSDTSFSSLSLPEEYERLHFGFWIVHLCILDSGAARILRRTSYMHECNVRHKEKKSVQSRVYTYMMAIYDISYLFGEDIWKSMSSLS